MAKTVPVQPAPLYSTREMICGRTVPWPPTTAPGAVYTMNWDDSTVVPVAAADAPYSNGEHVDGDSWLISVGIAVAVPQVCRAPCKAAVEGAQGQRG